MEIERIQQPGFEEVLRCRDPDSGLRAFIAIHDTRLGPALGGARMLPYADEESALRDVLSLAKAMTYKAAAAGLRLGGGKAVILGNPFVHKTKVLLRAMGRFVNALNGRYLTAKDAGISIEDLVEMAHETRYVTGLPEKTGGSGDPSPWTAISILEGMRAAVHRRWKRDDFKDLRVAIQGVGAVGLGLASLLHKEKAKLFVADPVPDALERARREWGAEPVPIERIHAIQADIFSPCALGGVINPRTVRELRAPLIVGGANNQLEDEAREDRALLKRKILYAPDYVVNAGGLINIYVRDILKQKDPGPWIRKVRETTTRIFSEAAQKGIGPAQAASEFAEAVLNRGGD